MKLIVHVACSTVVRFRHTFFVSVFEVTTSLNHLLLDNQCLNCTQLIRKFAILMVELAMLKTSYYVISTQMQDVAQTMF